MDPALRAGVVYKYGSEIRQTRAPAGDPAREGGILSGTGRDNAGFGRFWPLFVGLPLIALLAVAAIVLSGGGNGPSQPAPDDRPRASGNGGDPGLGTPTLGSEDAPVVMTEYSDYQ
ncbi:MAG TPA: hypothetical protein VGR18_08575 [Rubrobacter sp.]|nr:hypothetical protein [Rubrobacter sp.]